MELISKTLVAGSLEAIKDGIRISADPIIEQETQELPKEPMNRYQRRALAALERKNKQLTAKIDRLQKLNK